VVFFHVRSETVLFTDLIQQLPVNLISGWRSICRARSEVIAVRSKRRD
jgi:hypothetical protein